MRVQMCIVILKNIGRLLSYDFLKPAIFNPEFPAWFLIKLTLAGAIVDILLMIFDKEYLSTSGKSS